MAATTTVAISFVLLPLAFLTLLTPLKAATFTIVNQCSYTVWAAAVPAGGGIQLDNGQTWTIDVPAGTTGGRVWARTGCSFDASGNGNCQTGDCGGKLACTAYGTPPNTLAEFALNQFSNLDFFDISNVDGFNVGLDFSPETPILCSRIGQPTTATAADSAKSCARPVGPYCGLPRPHALLACLRPDPTSPHLACKVMRACWRSGASLCRRWWSLRGSSTNMIGLNLLGDLEECEEEESLLEDVRVEHFYPVVKLEGEEPPPVMVILVVESLRGVEGSRSEILPSFRFSLLRKVSRFLLQQNFSPPGVPASLGDRAKFQQCLKVGQNSDVTWAEFRRRAELRHYLGIILAPCGSQAEFWHLVEVRQNSGVPWKSGKISASRGSRAEFWAVVE
ncbi:Protein P21 [Dendrobium catenatum]|uniref:Protein P21 n=1 Tax=Dendrobium catenatum TaxID=906689 RepID=A0A2I0WKS8_9ASPA|nr:Protein P21 [Dendrobium catenatum]